MTLITNEKDLEIVRKEQVEHRNLDTIQYRQRYGEFSGINGRNMLTTFKDRSKWDRICEHVIDRVVPPLLENPKVQFMSSPCSLLEVADGVLAPAIAVTERIALIDWTKPEEEIEELLVTQFNKIFAEKLEVYTAVGLYEFMILQGPIFEHPNAFGVVSRIGRSKFEERVVQIGSIG